MYISNKIISSLFIIATSTIHVISTLEYPRISLQSERDFCLFLPPSPGLTVAVNEDNGIPFCTKPNIVPHSTVFPEGFITTAHYLKNTTYVQVTGFFDREKYDLSETDGGGQYDNHAHGKPIGAQCDNYNFFVSMIEPDINRFCIRCCQNEEDCVTGRSAYGCLRIIDGDYTDDQNYILNQTSTHLNTNMYGVLSEVDHLNSVSSPANANTLILNEITALQLNTYTTPEDLQNDWQAFSKRLVSRYPQIKGQVDRLQTMTTRLNSFEDWNVFFDLVRKQINQIQHSVSSAPAATKTYTATREDLEWLYSHRNEHENQATW